MTKFIIAPTHVYETEIGKEANDINDCLKGDIDDQLGKVRLEMHEAYDMS